MKKRIGLARAVAMNPQVVLYDEPTTGLDPIMADVINELIRTLQRELRVTSVVVTHDIKSAYHVGDRIAMLHEGRIILLGLAGRGSPDGRSGDPAVRRGKGRGPHQADLNHGTAGKRNRWNTNRSRSGSD